jgi:hypothetical protein
MKKALINIGIVIGVLFILWYIFKPETIKFDLKPYQNKIDSLEVEIVFIKKENDSLNNYVEVLEAENIHLSEYNLKLRYKIDDLKDDLEEARKAPIYTPSQIDSFFQDRYYKSKNPDFKDTIYLPVSVANSIILDLKEGDINRDIVTAQDSAITNLDKLISNKDTIINAFKIKEINYQKSDSLRLYQIEEYKKQIDGLKTEIKTINKKLKFSKIQKILLGVLGVGFIIAKK